jgi:hypothetical protein
MDNLEDSLGAKSISPEIAEIISQKIDHLMTSPPTMLCVNVVLDGASALKHSVCREIIMNATGASEQDADWYILRAGGENEIRKLLAIVAALEDNNAV